MHDRFWCKVHRLALGEPVDFNFVSDLLREAMCVWNECVESLRARSQNPDQLLELLDRECDSSVDEAAIQQAMKTVQERINQLKTIRIADTPEALKTLGLYIGCCLARFHCLMCVYTFFIIFTVNIYIYIYWYIYIYVFFLANGSNVTLYVYIHITVHITIPCRPHSKFWSLATTSKDGWLSHLCEMWHHSMWKLSPRKTSSVQPPRGCAGACVGKHATSEGALQRATSLQLRSGVVNGIPSEEGGSSVSWWEGFVQQISCNEETPPLLWTLSFREVHRFIWWHEWVCSIRSSSIWRVRSLQSTWRLSQSAYIDDAVMVWRHRGTRICHYSRWCVWWKTTSIHQRGLHLRCPLWLCSKIFKE